MFLLSVYKSSRTISPTEETRRVREKRCSATCRPCNLQKQQCQVTQKFVPPGLHISLNRCCYFSAVAAGCTSAVLIKTTLPACAPIWHLPLKIAAGSTCNLAAIMFPSRFDFSLSCSNSLTVILPFTLPVISALRPSIFPSTKPVGPTTILAELITFPWIVPSIRRSFSLFTL